MVDWVALRCAQLTAEELSERRQARGGTEDTLTGQVDFNTRFIAADMKHQVLLGGEYLQAFEKERERIDTLLGNQPSGAGTKVASASN